MIIAFSGHRPNKLPNKETGYKLPNPTYIKVCQEIEKTLIELKPEKVISGMALGVDQWAAHIAYKLKIPFIAAIPFAGQEVKWTAKSQKTFNTLLKFASEQVIVSEGEYTAHKLQIRNEWIVDNSNLLIAVWNGSSGGTSNCINYAKSKNKEIIFINPRSEPC